MIEFDDGGKPNGDECRLIAGCVLQSALAIVGKIEHSIGDCPERRSGVTLFELLVVLSVLALMSILAASAISPMTKQSALRQAGETMASDFKRARLEARLNNVPVSIEIRSDGYDIQAIELSRTFPGRVRLQLSHPSENQLQFYPSGFARGASFDLSSGAMSLNVSVEPITGRVRKSF